MDKRYLHHLSVKTRWISPWYFLLLALLAATICVFALRDNNKHMLELRDAVYAADKNGTDVRKPLQDLQAYVTSHMNTDLSAGGTSVYPPIQLKYTYQRLLEAQKQKRLQANKGLYSQAQAHCEALNRVDFSGHNRVPCIEKYVREHGNRAKTVPAVPDDLYKFSFASPRWSPDLAGWSMVLAALSGLLFIVTFAGRRWLRRKSR